MKYLVLSIGFLLLLGCENKTQETNNELATSYSPYFSLNENLDLAKFKVDTFLTFEYGDCWGSTYKFKFNNQTLVIDSMFCSEYSLHYSKYLLEKNEIKLAHLQESSTLIGNGISGPQYALREEIYDFQNKQKYFIIIDTFNKPDFKLLNTDYQDLSDIDLKNHISQLKKLFEGIWTRNGFKN
jgi:hypothetical protein